MVAILKGSFVFAADLIRALHSVGLTPEVDFMTLSSYKKARISSGQVSILRDMDLDVRGRNVLIVDDVLDSGRTLAFAKDLIAARGAASIRTCVLLDKQLPRAVNLEPDYLPSCAQRVRRRLRHGRGAPLPRAAVRRPRRAAVTTKRATMARILLADDDAATRDLVRRALEADGHSVHVTQDGSEALECVEGAARRSSMYWSATSRCRCSMASPWHSAR